MNLSRAPAAIALMLVASCAGRFVAPPEQSADSARALIAAVDALLTEGIAPARYDLAPLEAAIAAREPARIDAAAQALFLDVAADVNAGAIKPADRAHWRIAAPGPDRDAIGAVAEHAFSDNDFSGAFASLAPAHEQYQRLKRALAATPPSEKEKRARIALNMERWRWMPRDLGPDYILVNAPAFELYLHRRGALVDRRRVIVGSTKLPTPQIAARATGVAFNPTWFVPPSIVAESVGALMKNDPERAAALGYYVADDGGVRQKPGPANALGQMKLVMPNPYSVFLHDTPGKDAFKKDVRALSHGCVRVDDALGFAKLLLGDAVSEDELKEILAARMPREVALETPLPVYVGYFTAFVEDDGAVAFYPDVYKRDAPLLPAFGANPPAGDGDPIKSLIIETCPGVEAGATAG